MEIPNEIFQFHIQKLLYDSSENWERNTIFGPIRFNHDERLNDDSLHFQTRFGLETEVMRCLPVILLILPIN